MILQDIYNQKYISLNIFKELFLLINTILRFQTTPVNHGYYNDYLFFDPCWDYHKYRPTRTHVPTYMDRRCHPCVQRMEAKVEVDFHVHLMDLVIQTKHKNSPPNELFFCPFQCTCRDRNLFGKRK